MTLNELKEGQNATVTDIKLSGAIRRRLLDLGLIKGTEVKCIMKSHHGDPIAYRIRGALIALRNCDTEHIYVTEG